MKNAPYVRESPPIMPMILLAFVPLLGLLAFAAAVWTAIDAAKRGQNWFAWSVAVAITGLAFDGSRPSKRTAAGRPAPG